MMEVRFSGISEVRFYNAKKQNMQRDLILEKDLKKVRDEWNSQGGHLISGMPLAPKRFFELNDDDGTRDKTAARDLRNQTEAMVRNRPPENTPAHKVFLTKRCEMDNAFENRIHALIKKFDATPENQKTIHNVVVHQDKDDPNRVILESLPPGNRKKIF